jgi:hypothetical protein
MRRCLRTLLFVSFSTQRFQLSSALNSVKAGWSGSARLNHVRLDPMVRRALLDIGAATIVDP